MPILLLSSLKKSGSHRSLSFLICILLSVFAPTVAAQSIEAVGTPSTFDVATWNVEWFGSPSNGPSNDPLQMANVEMVLSQSMIEFWALQEVSSQQSFRKLLTDLGTDWEGQLATISGQQRIAFVYRKSVIQLRSIKHILTQFATSSNQPLNYFAGRPPLEIEVEVTLPDSQFVVTLITVHMKCCSDSSSYERRVNASAKLKNHIDFTTLGGKSVVILGDFNDELIRSISFGRVSPYQNFLDDGSNYMMPTLDLDRENIPTWCGSNNSCTSGSTIDHILMTDELISHYVDNSVHRLESVLTTFTASPGYTNTTSDHVPVFARFAFGTPTATDEEVTLPSRLIVRDLYPNPARDHIELIIEARAGRVASVEIVDILGRRMRTESLRLTPGSNGLRIATDALVPGLYFLRVTSDAGSDSRTFLVAGR